jgi:hypothetical protein
MRWIVREVAQRDKDARFTALFHDVSLDRLVAAYWAINTKAAPGADQVTWAANGQGLAASLQDLHERVQQGKIPASPSRRAFIAKADACGRWASPRWKTRSSSRPHRGAERDLRGGLLGLPGRR